MWTLAWLGITSLCLGAAWAVPPMKERRKAEKLKADFALYENVDLDNYDLTLDNYGEILDLSNYEELYDYSDLGPKIEVGTLAPRPKDPAAHPNVGATAETPKLQPPVTAGPLHPAPSPGQGESLPSCLLCLCIGTSVYCDDTDLEHIPLLPPATTDLKQLQFLHLSDNLLDYIPTPLPENLRSLHLQNNNIQTLQEDTFCNSQDPSQIRRALEDIRLDGNPINLSLFPNAYFCLPRLPTGQFF
ncbi:PREDICTED: opticin [Chaetura pelagica]|uniref:opticin n=1 Tax=Chaetura pelagica TaxID=8897 RepID=UPI0005238C2F|nr:PREDICTED: opticin [Chaetura pelagica]